MKTAKRIVALGLALMMMLAVFAFPAGAADSRIFHYHDSSIPRPRVTSVSVTGTTVSFIWNQEECAGYEIHMLDNNTGEFKLIQTIANNKRHSYTTPRNLGLEPGTMYLFAIYCYNVSPLGIKTYGRDTYVTGTTTPKDVQWIRYNAKTSSVVWDGVVDCYANMYGYQVEVTIGKLTATLPKSVGTVKAICMDEESAIQSGVTRKTYVLISDGNSNYTWKQAWLSSTNVPLTVRVRSYTMSKADGGYTSYSYGAWSPLLTIPAAK